MEPTSGTASSSKSTRPSLPSPPSCSTAASWRGATPTAAARCRPTASATVIASAGGVTQVAGTMKAFAVLTSDGSVVAWGDANFGGDASAVDSQLVDAVGIASTQYAFAARLQGGGVVA